LLRRAPIDGQNLVDNEQLEDGPKAIAVKSIDSETAE
jgi:hypothetical protein